MKPFPFDDEDYLQAIPGSKITHHGDYGFASEVSVAGLSVTIYAPARDDIGLHGYFITPNQAATVVRSALCQLAVLTAP